MSSVLLLYEQPIKWDRVLVVIVTSDRYVASVTSQSAHYQQILRIVICAALIVCSVDHKQFSKFDKTFLKFSLMEVLKAVRFAMQK